MSIALLRRTFPSRAAAGVHSTASISYSFVESSSYSDDDADEVVSTAVSVLTHRRSKSRWSELRTLFPNGFVPTQIIQILLRIGTNIFLARSFFNFATQHYSLSSPLPLQCYAPIIHIAARAHQKTYAQTLIKEAIRSSELVGSDDQAKRPKLFRELVETYRVFKSTPLVFDLLIEGFLDVNKLDPCIEIVRLLRSRGFRLHVKTCNLLVSTASRIRGPDFGYDLYREFFESNHDGDDKKSRHNLVPNAYTFNALMAAFLRYGSVDMVEELWIQMAKLHLTPTVYSYGILMAAYCKEGAVEKARIVWDDLKEKGLRPDVGAYNVLIGGYCRMGEIEKAEELYREMGLNELQGNCVTYEHLINGYCLRGDAENALLVYKDMCVKGLIPDDSTLNTMVRVLCDRKSVLEAFEFFKMIMGNADFLPSETSFLMLIKGLCREGKMDEALKLQAQMAGKGFKPSSHIYIDFIDGYEKQRNPDMAERLREEMIASQTQ